VHRQLPPHHQPCAERHSHSSSSPPSVHISASVFLTYHPLSRLPLHNRCSDVHTSSTPAALCALRPFPLMNQQSTPSPPHPAAPPSQYSASLVPSASQFTIASRAPPVPLVRVTHTYTRSTQNRTSSIRARCASSSLGRIVTPAPIYWNSMSTALRLLCARC
jgi:hypothetical protein